MKSIADWLKLRENYLYSARFARERTRTHHLWSLRCLPSASSRLIQCCMCVFAVCVRCPCVHFQGWTALLLAVANGDKAVVETLLGHDGINVNYANSKYMKNGHFWSLPYTGCFDDRATRPRLSFDFSH